MELQGAVHHISDEQQVSASYTKRELVIKTNEQYPQFINIEFSQGKCNLELDALIHGTVVKVHINIGGREWVNPQGETKYFNSIKGWRIEKIGEGTAPAQQIPPASATATSQPSVNQTSTEAFATATDFKEEEHDDLPFK